MSQRRWPPSPIAEEEAVSLAREVGYEAFTTDESDVPARGTVDQKTTLLGADEKDDDTVRTPNSPVNGRGRHAESSYLDDDTTASTIFTQRTPSPYAYTQSSTSNSSHRRKGSFHSHYVGLDDGAADLIKSTPSSPVSSRKNNYNPYMWDTPGTEPVNSCSDSDCSCCSSCSGCSDDFCDGHYRSINSQAKKQSFSEPPLTRHSGNFKNYASTIPPVFGLTTPLKSDPRQASPSFNSKTSANQKASQTPPALRLSMPGSDDRAKTPPAFIVSPPTKLDGGETPSRPGHRHSRSCNAIPQSPTFDKPRRIIDFGGVLRNRFHSSNLSPSTSPKLGSSHKLPLSTKRDEVPIVYHSQPPSQRGSRTGSPVPPSQFDNLTGQSSAGVSSPLTDRPSIRKRHHSFHSGAQAGAPQIIVQPPIEDKVPVASAFAIDDATTPDLGGPIQAVPGNTDSTRPGKVSPSHCAQQASPVYFDDHGPPRMARSHSDDPRSRPYDGTSPDFYERRTGSGSSGEAMSPSSVHKNPYACGRGTTGFYDHYDATPLPPCPRTDLASCNEWYVLKGTSSTIVCPSCVHNIVPSWAHHRFVRTPPPHTGAAMVCDFSCSWLRAAWLISLRGRNIDLDFLEWISSIKPDNLGCLPRSYTSVGGWYTLDSRHGVQGDKLLMCTSCTKRMTAILPSMGEEVKRIHRKRIHGQPSCIFRPQNRQASLLVGELVAAQVAVLRSNCSSMDLSQFITQVRTLQGMRGDSRDCGDFHNGDDDSMEDRDRVRRVRRWHVIPQLPVCTVCDHCFEEVVRPELEAGHPLAQFFTTSNMPGRKGVSGAHGPSTFTPSSPARSDHRNRHNRHHRRQNSRRSDMDDDVFGPRSSHSQISAQADVPLAILGDGKGGRGGCKTSDGLDRICYFHSPRMRSVWQKALQANDFEVLRAGVVRLRSREVELQERIVELRRLRETLKGGGLGGRLGDTLGDAFRRGMVGRDPRRYRRNSMGSVDARSESGSFSMNLFGVERELKRLEEEWRQLKE